ncbi:CDGSH iron-sulfur domain-containing protein [Natrarchaeobius sp. A-rgal3]|uniref:CDGSH iron-sulfur domain-containing protein n=1 Tax=Natrarchaeobius versutus TaxID=1679078 RepID=UPI0035107B0B
MKEDIHQYFGEDIVVEYDVNRCIHARECVRGLPNVFDPDKRPWIEPDEAAVEELRSVIMDCPTGALQFEQPDAEYEEPVPKRNTVSVVPDGPLYLSGDVEITASDGTVLLEETRVALCRCGASSNKPLCDNSHEDAEFEASGTISADESTADHPDVDGTVRVTPVPDGPLRIEGRFEMQGQDGGSKSCDSGGSLCRCGGSQEKPDCDGTHAKIGFSSDLSPD